MQKAVYWLEKAAKQEMPQAVYELGNMYMKGIGVECDEAKGTEYIIQAADLGMEKAYFQAGLTFYQGDYGYPVDKKKAFEYWTNGSEAGDVNCTRNVAILYSAGDGVERDYSNAITYFEKAADQGSAEALCRLGAAYCEDGFAEHDEKKAMEYFKRVLHPPEILSIIYIHSKCYIILVYFVNALSKSKYMPAHNRQRCAASINNIHSGQREPSISD